MPHIKKPRKMKNLLKIIPLSLLFAGATPPAAVGRPKPADAEISHPIVRVGGRAYRCNVVRLHLGSGGLSPRVMTAQGGIGRTDSFEALVRQSHAVAAINGSYFDAYNKTGDKDPGMTLIRGGQVIHKGANGTVIGFAPHHVVIGRLNLPIRGTVNVNGRIAKWYAYWLNRTPTNRNNVAIFTPARGSRARVSDGLCIVVNHNRVERIVAGDAPIPLFGYIIHLRGSEKENVNLFPVGATVGFEILRDAGRESALWNNVSEAVGAGPRLLRDGQIEWHPLEEGFTEPKILATRGLRSAIGVTRDGAVFLATVSGPTGRELCDVMKKLGAYQALNLDGGASTGLYANGRYLNKPGRLLSNALVFYR